MNDRVRLILLSFLMLFVELALIRWTGSNVVYLSYFSNFVLLGSFLGIGLGFLRADRSRQLFSWAPLALTALIAFVRFFPVDIRQSTGGNLLFFSALRTSGPPRALVLTVIFLVVAATMAFIADGVARAFSRFEPLEAYFLDLVGAIGGIVSFSLLSFLRAPPVAWGLVAAALLLVLLRPRVNVLQLLALGGMVAILLAESLASNASWSPYYKVTVEAGGGNTPFVYVNGVPHQAILKARRQPAVHDAVRACAAPLVGRCAHHRCRRWQRRVGGVGEGGTSCRCCRDRPSPLSTRQGAPSRAPV